MAVLIGSARIDENGKISGGQAGDQTGNEVGTQNWYLHSKKWVLVRAVDASVRKKIATAMRSACSNNNIGYDQGNRDGLYKEVKNAGFDPAKCTKKTETDCSALVRVCVHYAGLTCGDFNTSSLVSVLSKVKGKDGKLAFEVIKDASITGSSDYLLEGDILVTATKGHTVVVLSDGPKAKKTTTTTPAPAPAAPAPAPTKKVVYYPKYSGASSKLDDAFRNIGAPYGNVTKRKPVAVANGIKDYKGTATQNINLLKLAKSGKLIKP